MEDTPYFVIRIDGTPHQNYTLWINDETQEPLDPTTLQYQPGRMICKIKKSHGSQTQGMEAKFLHAPYFDLLKNLEEDPNTYYLVIKKIRIDLAKRN